MGLSSDLISQFAKLTKQEPTQTSNGKIVNGTAVEYAGTIYVQLDGTDQLTPITSSTAGMKDGDRITVMIKDHTTTVTGNVSSPSAGQSDLDQVKEDVSDQISEFEIIIADKVSVDDFDAEKGRIDELTSDNVLIKERLTATEADIGTLTAENATITGRLDVAEGNIDDLTANMLTAEVADIKYATIENLEATNADIHNLEADYGEFKVLSTEKFAAQDASITNLTTTKLDAEQAKLLYANIDFANIGQLAIENFFSKSGMISDLVVGEGTVTGKLVGVTIVGDLIEGGTVKADKLVVQGEDGLYYKLNVSGESVAAQQTEYNSLNGSIITAKSITAEKVNVNDLVAFGATIGGFHITESSLYSGTKSTVSNTTRGVYLDDQGQVAFGDESNYLRYFQDTDGSWKLAISANAIKLGSSGKSIEESLEEIQTSIEDIDIDVNVGARNLIRNSETLIYGSYILSDIDPSTTDTPEEPAEQEESEESQDPVEALYNSEYNYHEESSVTTPFSRDDIAGKFIINLPNATFTFTDILDIGQDYMFGCWVKSDAPGSIVLDGVTTSTSTEWYRLTQKFTATVTDMVITFPIAGNYYFYHSKLETGTVATDWSPAPEDLDDSDDIDRIDHDVETVLDQVVNNESSIEILEKSIQSLVTDANGTSLMTQTSEGWTFNIGGLQSTVEEQASSIDEIQGDISQVSELAQATKDLADDIAEKTAYVNITQDDEGAPCIELGKIDNPFKLRITNTSIDFMEDGQRIAYITNRQLYIQSSVVTDEFKVGVNGGFIWKKRGNGNMGLRWENI